MSKRQRERKLARLQAERAERELAASRRTERLKPLYSLTRNLVVTLLVTILLLLIGRAINDRISQTGPPPATADGASQ
jgi:hypothetical protein